MTSPEGRHDADVADVQRDEARAARRSLEPAERARAQTAICRLLCALAELDGGGRLGWYLPTDGEVDLEGAVATLRSGGWELLLPVVGPGRSMTFATWGPDVAVAPNQYGIPEPEHEPGDLVTATVLDAVVVPCVALDRAGHRLGFGAGYYDRALADARRTVRIGVAFEVQVVPHVEPAPWDVPLDVVVTETGVHRLDAHDPGRPVDGPGDRDR